MRQGMKFVIFPSCIKTEYVPQDYYCTPNSLTVLDLIKNFNCYSLVIILAEKKMEFSSISFWVIIHKPL